jgi:hypothetical protein
MDVLLILFVLLGIGICIGVIVLTAIYFLNLED